MPSYDYELTDTAEQDLEEIGEFTIRTWDMEQWLSHYALLVRTFERIAEFPTIGRTRPDVGPGVRSLVARPYTIVYAVKENRLFVMRVVHQRRGTIRDPVSDR